MLFPKKISVIGCALALLCTSSVFASAESHNAAASKLLQTMNMEKLLTESTNSMLALELQNNPQLRPFESTMKSFFEKYMSAASLEGDFIRLYTETFTEKELYEMSDFYMTPTGQKALAAAPKLMAQGAAIGQQRVMANIGELQKMIEAEAKRITDLQSAQ